MLFLKDLLTPETEITPGFVLQIPNFSGGIVSLKKGISFILLKMKKKEFSFILKIADYQWFHSLCGHNHSHCLERQSKFHTYKFFFIIFLFDNFS